MTQQIIETIYTAWFKSSNQKTLFVLYFILLYRKLSEELLGSPYKPTIQPGIVGILEKRTIAEIEKTTPTSISDQLHSR